MTSTVAQSLRVKFIRKDIGGNYCVHVDLVNGAVGFSNSTPPPRPPEAGVWLDDDHLLELQDVVNQTVRAKGLRDIPEPPKPPPVRESASAFFQANFKTIITHQVGRMKSPPWWLRWLYSAVVTKEPCNDNNL